MLVWFEFDWGGFEERGNHIRPILSKLTMFTRN